VNIKMAFKIKMKKWKSKNGCEASFDERIPKEEVEKRLSWMGSGWEEVK
jgi:hypothetical protein